jgi:hypothetical protein
VAVADEPGAHGSADRAGADHDVVHPAILPLWARPLDPSGRL